ncbi:platelet endothelial aggregation receptor 1-like isoform X4 [Equus caballus]|uniref:platelet endothelial aggregation receptor 1-like isoform X4 n=1 Tax=Equus caballus TaxID=9796 RepID=UPI0038B30715
MESEHSPCSPGDPATHPCPAGHYCPGGSETHPGTPQACPEHTYLAAEGGQSQAECLPCPAGYHCSSPGLSSFEGHPCPPGHWCPGDQGAFLCPPGTFRTEPGASLWEDCELCPPGYYCPEAQLRGQATVFPIACRAGSECPAGAVAEVSCRAGSYCGPQTGVPPLCPGGYACPAGSSTYSGPGQLCEFPYYCPPGSTHPLACPGGSEALNGSGLRISKESCCRLCEAGTYRNRAVDALPCQPCPARFSCHQGASHCTCWGLNRVFQKSDGSCICQARHESSDERGLQSDESDGAEDCQPQVMPCSIKERKT